MATTLPVPIEFGLPEGWRAAPPDEVNAPGAAFVALHPRPDAGFTANITIDGEYRPDNPPLTDIADEAVAKLQQVAEQVSVAHRTEIGSAEAPGLTQTLTFAASDGGSTRALGQSHVYLAMIDTENPEHRAIIRLIFTATAEQYETVLPDFQEFIRTVRPETQQDSA